MAIHPISYSWGTVVLVNKALEALRILADEHRGSTVVFDDMWVLAIVKAKCRSWHRIGAFVRAGRQPVIPMRRLTEYLRESPQDQRPIVIPITSCRKVIAGWPVDVFLYANNYERVTRKTLYPVLQRDR